MGILSALFGGLPVFVIYVLTALLHECGHIFCAMRMGFKCEKISLMPYGAAAFCDTEGISPADEIKLALSGPAVNAFMLVLTAGLWWFFPVTYAFTDTVFAANAVMLAINILPAYPLDGGKAVSAFLRLKLPKKTVNLILKISALIFFAGFLCAFIFAYRNVSLLTFSVFLLFSAFEKDTGFQRINFGAKKPKRGREIKHVIINENTTFKDALRYSDGGKYMIFDYYSDGVLDEICEDELYEMLKTKSIYDKII